MSDERRDRLRHRAPAACTRRTTSSPWVRPGPRPGRARGAAVHAGRLPGHVPRAACGRCASTRAWRRPRRRTRASATCWSTGRRACRSRSTCRRRWAWTPTTRGPRARSARPASRSTRSRTWRGCSTDIPLDRVSTSMTINATARDPAAAVRAGGRGAGRRRRPDQRHRAERHPQGVRGARDLHLPAASRRCGSITDLFAYCGERIPTWNTISISGYHMREAGSTAAQEIAFTLADGIAYVQAALDAGPRGRRFRAAAVVLLRVPHELLRGDREVPRGAADVGDGS